MELIIGPRLYSTWSLRPWLVLKHCKADFSVREIDIYSPGGQAEMDFLPLVVRHPGVYPQTEVGTLQSHLPGDFEDEPRQFVEMPCALRVAASNGHVENGTVPVHHPPGLPEDFPSLLDAHSPPTAAVVKVP